MQETDSIVSSKMSPRHWDPADLTGCIEKKDVLGSIVQFSEKFADILVEKRDGSERFLPFITYLLERPYEIWLQVYKGIDTGAIHLVQIYVAGYQTEDGDFLLILKCDPLRGNWIASDLFEVTPGQANELRSGILAFPKT